jgi:hypothetical protein
VLESLAASCATSAQLLAHDGDSVVVVAQALPKADAQPYRTTRIGARFEPGRGGGAFMLPDEHENAFARALRADIVMRAIGPSDDTVQRFSIGLAGPLDANACRALVDAAERLTASLRDTASRP